MAAEKITFEQKFAKLKAEYVAQLPQKLADIHDGWSSLKTKHSIETITILHRNVHTLIGTSGTFGFSALCQSARHLEEILKPLVEHNTQNFTFNTELSHQISTSIQHLSVLLEAIQKEINDESNPST